MSAAAAGRGTAAESLVGALVDAGIDTVFANPGTTEMPLVAALDACGDAVTAVLALHETVCSAAADGYWRARGRPAATLLHLGPGVANAAANFHNAQKARAGIVNLIGDHPNRHLSVQSPLQTPLESLCRLFSDWTGFASDPAQQAAVARTAVGIAATGRVASLIVPHDVQLAQVGPTPRPLSSVPGRPRSAAIPAAIAALARATRPALLLGGPALGKAGLRLAARLGARVGAPVFCETLFAAMDRGGDIPQPTRLAYFPEQAIAQLAGHDLILLVGAAEPVAFFAYPDLPSRLAPSGAAIVAVATAHEDCALALAELLDAVPAAPDQATACNSGAGQPSANAPGDRLTPQTLCEIVAAAIPAGAVVVDEGITTGLAFYNASLAARPFRHLCLTGGAIGWGPGASVGAALGARAPVINLQADGSSLYAIQALWTQARHSLPVTTVICRNGRYRILETELARAGLDTRGRHAAAMCDLAGIDWCTLAQGFGVRAVRARSVGELTAALEGIAERRGPLLIEAVI